MHCSISAYGKTASGGLSEIQVTGSRPQAI